MMESLPTLTENMMIGDNSRSKNCYAYIQTGNEWMDQQVKYILKIHLPSVRLISTLNDFPRNKHHLIQISVHEWGDPGAFNLHFQAGDRSIINAFPNVDALSRKDYMASVASHWMTKYQDTILKRHIPTTVVFEVDYAEYLDDALAEAESYELCTSLEANQDKEPSDREWWILKPAMCDLGYGIHLFSTLDELKGCFESVHDTEEDEDEDYTISSTLPSSALRRFVAQKYIASPHILQGKKFHIRTYVMALGRLKVFVYREMVILSASEDYQPPWVASSPSSYLTNTAIQDQRRANAFWDINESSMPAAWKENVFDQICGVSAEIFQAAARVMGRHFTTIPGSFEIFGLDFLVDGVGSAWLLEVNAGPDDADHAFWSRLLNAVLYKSLKETHGEKIPKDESAENLMVQVLAEDLGPSNIMSV